MDVKTFPRKEDYIWGALLFIMILSFNYEMIWKDQVPFFRDLGTYFYPLRLRLAEALGRGEVPLWDRHEGMGFPLLADFQSGCFYLPHVAYLLFPFFTAVRALFVFHYLVAAAGSYRLCRHWGFPPYLAVIGALLYTLGGTLVSLSNLLNHFQAAIWFPWAVLFWERALVSKARKDFFCLTGCLLLQFLGGSPEVYVMSMGLLLLDGLRIKSEDPTLNRFRPFLLLAGVNVLVAGLAMIQLLPTVELFLESRGRFRIGYVESAAWSLEPWSLVNLFFLDKEVDPNKFNGFHLFFAGDIPLLTSHYMGIASLFGFCLWLLCSSWKERGLLLGLILVSLVVALGSYTPVYSLLYRHAPFFSLVRFPEKFFFVTWVLLLFVALRGLHAFLECGRLSSRTTLLGLLAIVGFWMGLYLFCRLDSAALLGFVSWIKQDSLSQGLRTSSGVLFALERQVVLVLGISMLLFLWQTGKIQIFLLRALMAAVVCFDLASAHMPYHQALRPDFIFQGRRTLVAPDSERHRLFYYPTGSSLHPSSYVLSRDQQPSFFEFNALLFDNLLPNTGVFHGFEYMQEMNALRRWPYLVFLEVANRLSPDAFYRLLAALNVKYVSSLKPLPEGRIELAGYFPEFPSWLYKIPSALPRTYIASRAAWESNPVKVIERLSSEEFHDLEQVFLEKPLSIEATHNFHARATVVDYTNHRVTIQASLNGPGVLVLADAFYPGWRVSVDGQEREILRANLFFRGVLLEHGTHSVEFRYRPSSFFIGMGISLATLGGLAWGVVLRRPRGKSRVVASSWPCRSESKEPRSL